MSNTEQRQPPYPESLQLGYEPAHAPVKGLLLYFFFFVLTAVVLHTGLWVLVLYYSTFQREPDLPQSVVQATDRFTEPKLQPTESHNTLPWQDLSTLLDLQQQRLLDMGWTHDVTTGQWFVPQNILQELQQRYAQKTPTTREAKQ